MARRLRFDRDEWSGSCGDIGTDLPLLVAAMAVGGMPAAWLCVAFGIAQVASGLIHRIPMPVQPLKALAALVIAGGLSFDELRIATGILAAAMLLLAVTPWLGWVCRHLPDPVVRAIQAALGVKLLVVALGLLWPNAVADAGTAPAEIVDLSETVEMSEIVGLALGLGVLVLLLAARWLRGRYGSRWSWWWAPLLVVLGLATAVWTAFSQPDDLASAATAVSNAAARSGIEWWVVVAAVAAQLPLSLSNAVIATHHLARTWYGADAPSVRRIALSYAASNATLAAAGAFPVCHGSGGLAGHYANGARTGGSVIIYGAVWMALGGLVFWFDGQVLHYFPTWLLGGFLLLEAGVMLARIAGMRQFGEISVAMLTLGVAVLAPGGFAAALIAGWLLWLTIRSLQARR